MSDYYLNRDGGKDAPGELGQAANNLVNSVRETVEFLTPNMAKAARERAERGYIFDLRWTGGKAHVRRINPADRAMIATLPDHLQEKVFRALAEIAQSDAALDPKTGIVSVSKGLKNLGKLEDTVNAYCVAGFIQPQLIFIEADRTDENQVVVTDIDWMDRYDYFQTCTGEVEDATKRLEPFPRKPLGDVATRGPLQLGEDAERVTSPRGFGV
jgi:hypothetical protein